MFHSFIKMHQSHVRYIYLFGALLLCSNARTNQRFVTSMTCEKHLIQTWCVFEQDVIGAAIG